MVRNIERTFSSKAKSHSSSVASRMRALVHEAGAVEQDVDRAGIERRLGDVGRVQHVQLGGVDAIGGDLVHQRLVHVGGDDPGAFGGEGQRGGAADALAGGGDEGGLAGEGVGHGDLQPAAKPAVDTRFTAGTKARPIRHAASVGPSSAPRTASERRQADPDECGGVPEPTPQFCAGRYPHQPANSLTHPGDQFVNIVLVARKIGGEIGGLGEPQTGALRKQIGCRCSWR